MVKKKHPSQLSSTIEDPKMVRNTTQKKLSMRGPLRSARKLSVYLRVVREQNKRWDSVQTAVAPTFRLP